MIYNLNGITLSAWIYPTADGQSFRSTIAGKNMPDNLCCGNIFCLCRNSKNKKAGAGDEAATGCLYEFTSTTLTGFLAVSRTGLRECRTFDP